MSEIERAIAYWEEFEREIDEMPHSEILEAQREPVRTALTVLRAELEREKNEPMTIDELSEMGGKPYWHVSLDGNGSYWNILDGWVATIPNDYHYGERWLAYRYEPKGESK